MSWERFTRFALRELGALGNISKIRTKKLRKAGGSWKDLQDSHQEVV